MFFLTRDITEGRVTHIDKIIIGLSISEWLFLSTCHVGLLPWIADLVKSC